MINKVVELAIFYPHKYPWERSLTKISEKEIINILENKDLITKISRDRAKIEIELICYLTATKAKDYDDLKKKIFEALKDKKYISENLVEKVLSKKNLFDANKVKVYIKFINNSMTIDEKNKFEREINGWLIDLLNYYKYGIDDNYEISSVGDYVLEIMNEFYGENKFNLAYINKLMAAKGFKNLNFINEIYEVSSKFKSKLSELLDKYINKSNNENFISSVEDELFEIINDITEFDLKDELKNENFISSIENEVHKKSQIENTKKSRIVKVENKFQTTEKKIEIHLRELAKSLGYKLLKINDDFQENLEVELLKELAAYKKGAVISELYNACVDFDNVSKENLEAIINNFFTSLKLQGFEVDDRNSVGNNIYLDTKDLLSDFVLTNPISEKGTIKGEIKYLPWMYKGKKITPMIVKPLKM